jgi:glycosyltransferase EpsF
VPVRICHNHTTAHWGEGVKTLLKYILRPFNKVFATDYFACGETAGRWMYGDRCFDRGEVTVMPNAIDTEQFAFDPAARAALREELGIPQDAFVVGHVGRFMYQKNHRFLVDIFAEVLKKKPEAVLLLVGEGELMESIREKVKARGISSSVVFTGARREVNKLYSVMDVFCLPSFYEGMPVVAWEAQANGLPCVFSNKISQEAGNNFLSLSQGIEKWEEALLSIKGRKICAILGINEFAIQLMKFYLRQLDKE